MYILIAYYVSLVVIFAIISAATGTSFYWSYVVVLWKLSLEY
jgi:hypothetical protein